MPSPDLSTIAFSYLRVSGLGQLHGDGLDRQREAIARRAEQQGLRIEAEFVDGGVSGTAAMQDRPALTELLQQATRDGVSVVLVERADRLARDLIEGELILRELSDAGIRVIEAEGGLDLTEGSNPTAQLVRQVLGAVAEFEKSALVAKLRAARERKRRTEGRCEGPQPFGALPGEQEALEALLRLSRRRNGKRPSAAWIAGRMDQLGHKPRRGDRWSRSTVRTLLRRAGKRA